MCLVDLLFLVLQNMVPAFYHCCSEVVAKWDHLVLDKGLSCEVDVWPWLVSMTADVISHAAFGSTYREGQRIFELQGELSGLIAQELKKPYIPGLRLVNTPHPPHCLNLKGYESYEITCLVLVFSQQRTIRG